MLSEHVRVNRNRQEGSANDGCTVSVWHHQANVRTEFFRRFRSRARCTPVVTKRLCQACWT